MRVGKLNERIEILRLNSSIDEWGQSEKIWQRQYELWAEVASISSDEKLAAAKLVSESGIKFKTRFYSDISEADLLKWRGKEYEIKGIAMPQGIKGGVLELYTQRISRQNIGGNNEDI